MKYPDVPFRHLQRMTDHVGLLEHAEGIVPRHEHGYCVDDVARGVVVVCREPSPSQELIILGRRYLYFLAQAQAPDGRFRNRLGYDRRWHDQPGTQDCWGRALWALGTAAARGSAAGIREDALTRFDRSAGVASPWPHAMAFAALGAAEILDRWPGHPGALALLDRATTSSVRRPRSHGMAMASIEAQLRERGHRRGRHRGRGRTRSRPGPAERPAHARAGCSPPRPGTVTCRWCRSGAGVPARSAPLSTSSRSRWRRWRTRACAAAAVTGDSSWLAGVRLSVAWFLGDNDAKIPLFDERTGGCCDGLGPTSRSRNQGAESTLAMISVLQQARRLAAAPR